MGGGYISPPPSQSYKEGSIFCADIESVGFKKLQVSKCMSGNNVCFSIYIIICFRNVEFKYAHKNKLLSRKSTLASAVVYTGVYVLIWNTLHIYVQCMHRYSHKFLCIAPIALTHCTNTHTP